MVRFLLDTNHLSEGLRPVSHVRDRIGKLRLNGIIVGTCIPVICELEAVLPAGERGEKYHRALQSFLGRVRLWPLDLEVARNFGAVYKELRQRGRVMSQVDMMLAALARQMDLTIATTDLDFGALPDLRTENWVNAVLGTQGP